MMKAPYRELLVWQKAMELTDEVYRICKKLPKEETYALSDQIRRAVVSIPSNIAEGQRRNTTKDFVHFLSIADGSCAELETQIEIAVRQKMITETDAAIVFELSTAVGKMLNKLMQSLSSNH